MNKEILFTNGNSHSLNPAEPLFKYLQLVAQLLRHHPQRWHEMQWLVLLKK